MIKTRFMVLKMKDIIRTGAFILIGVVLLVALIWAVVPNRDGGGIAPSTGIGLAIGDFTPGTYTSYIILHNRPLTVSVTVDENSILDIGISELPQAVEVFYPLIRPTMVSLSQEIISTQSTHIYPELASKHTTGILLEAVNNALAQAKAPVAMY